MNIFKSLFGTNNSHPEDGKEKADKRNFEILKYDGIRAQHLHRYDYAIQCFAKALEIEEDGEIYDNLSNAYVTLGRLGDARQTLDRWIVYEPENVRPLILLTNLCFMQEDYVRMREACQQALSLEAQNPLLYYLSARIEIEEKHYAKAIEALNKAIELKSDYIEAYLLRANVWMETQQTKEAMADILQILSIDPNNEDAALLKGEAEMAENQRTEAEKSIQNVIAMNPFNRRAYLLLGKLYQDEKVWEKAIQVYSDAIEVLPEFVDAYQQRSKAKLETGDKEGAEADMKKALELHPIEEGEPQEMDFEKMKQNIPF